MGAKVGPGVSRAGSCCRRQHRTTAWHPANRPAPERGLPLHGAAAAPPAAPSQRPSPVLLHGPSNSGRTPTWRAPLPRPRRQPATSHTRQTPAMPARPAHLNFVSPSTMRRTAAPKWKPISSSPTTSPQSSTVSCSRPAVRGGAGAGGARGVGCQRCRPPRRPPRRAAGLRCAGGQGQLQPRSKTPGARRPGEGPRLQRFSSPSTHPPPGSRSPCAAQPGCGPPRPGA